MNKLTLFLDNIFENEIVKKTIRYIFILFVLYFISNYVNSFTTKFLLIDPKTLTNIPLFLIYPFFGLGVVYISYLFLLKKYQPSELLIDFIIISVSFFLIIRFLDYEKGWSLISLNEYFYYLDFIAVLGILSLLFLWYNHINPKEIKSTNTPFVIDEPISTDEEDKINYKERANEIFNYIKRFNFNASFTIGIVGPWGNGKSSLIKLVEKRIKEEKDINTLHLKFLPYLNHNEEDIISEFFNQLSSEIRKYNGQLSNEFLDYSDRLLKLYNSKKITDFLKSKTNTSSSKSSYDTYNKINRILKKVNKKCIVFIDDLDRLNNKEILQVLKLVRNSANFQNFTFLIAIDKDYVLESLTQKTDIINHKFLDKFFQLEVYLPEIEKDELKTDFIKSISNTDLKSETKFINELQECIYLNKNLFDDYIQNYRDVKRLVNQLVFDYKTLPDKLNTNDFLNFTYLKMSFPSMIKFLGSNWFKIIPFNPKKNLCELIILKDGDKSDSKYNLVSNRSREKIFILNNGLNIDYSKYEISKNIDTDITIEQNNLTKRQNLLILKTLIVLFGKENDNKTYTSIKFENNFRKLIQQKVLSTDLTEVEFETIFNFKNDFDNLKKSLDKGFANSILNRLAFYNTNDKEKAYKTIMILLYLFSNADKYNLNSVSTWQTLLKFLKRVINNEDSFFKKGKEGKELWQKIEKDFLSNQKYPFVKRIEFTSLISSNRTSINFDTWGIEEETLKNHSLEIYKNFLKDRSGKIWEYNDYSFYHCYHNIIKLHNKEVINPITITFWDKNDITILCAQMVENDAWTTKMLKTSDYVKSLFNSKDDYKKYIDHRIDNLKQPTKELKEYKNFLFLESLTHFTKHIRFDFKNFDLINNKLDGIKNLNNLQSDEFDNIVEVVYESNVRSLFEVTTTDAGQIPGFISVIPYSDHLSKIFHTFYMFKSDKIHNSISESLKHFKRLLENQGINSEIDFENRKLITENRDYIKIISIQPSEYS